jgi:hypothetical protein
MAVLPQEGWSLKPVPERPLTFFPEGKAVADWRAFEDVFAGRVAVKGGPEEEAVGAVGAEKIKAGAKLLWKAAGT